MAASSSSKRQARVQTTPEEREKKLQSMAYDLAEKQLADGTATSQIITTLLKDGGVRGQIEMEKLRSENRLLNARVENLEALGRMEASIEEALLAFRSYQPSSSDDSD